TDFINYIAGVQFEQPIGNRGPEAIFRQRRLERLQAVLDYATAVRNAVLEVKNALRRVVTNYTLIEQTRVARLAAAENLRALLVEEQTLRGLTPDFLTLMLNRQESLAQAELEEANAILDYKVALAEYYDAIGASLGQMGIELSIPTTDELLERGVERDRPASGGHAAEASSSSVRPGRASGRRPCTPATTTPGSTARRNASAAGGASRSPRRPSTGSAPTPSTRTPCARSSG